MEGRLSRFLLLPQEGSGLPMSKVQSFLEGMLTVDSSRPFSNWTFVQTPNKAVVLGSKKGSAYANPYPSVSKRRVEGKCLHIPELWDVVWVW